MKGNNKNIKIFSKDNTAGVIPLEVEKLGRPYHKLPKVVLACFDNIDSSLVYYFLKKYRMSISLEAITFDENYVARQVEVFSNSAGNIGFDLDRELLLGILDDYYGFLKEEGRSGLPASASGNGNTPLTKTEERLKNTLGIELAEWVINQEAFGAPTPCKTEHAAQIGEWAYRLTFVLAGGKGAFYLFLDTGNVDRLLCVLRQPTGSLTTSLCATPHSIESLPVRLHGKLCSLSLTLAQLLGLKEGSILPVSLPDTVAVFVGREQIFNAVVAEDRGKLFFSEFTDTTSENKHD